MRPEVASTRREAKISACARLTSRWRAVCWCSRCTPGFRRSGHHVRLREDAAARAPGGSTARVYWRRMIGRHQRAALF